MKIRSLMWGVAMLLSTSCQEQVAGRLSLIPTSAFDATIDGREVSLYTLSNEAGMTMQVTNYGGRVVSLFAPDRDGNMADIVMGYDSLYRYLNNTGERFLGAAIGRYGNRIADGRFSVDGEDYQLSTYNNGQCLHGGDVGFDKVVWCVDSLNRNSIYLSYISIDMEEGFPGELRVRMSYRLTDENEFRIDYHATTTKTTPINLTHHSFFNLKGEGKGTINDHMLRINADYYTPIDSSSIPTGEIAAVSGTPFDFRKAHAISKYLNEQNEQLSNGSGYDHNFVLNRRCDEGLEFAASVYEPVSGRYMEVWTTEPALQFYGGNFFDGKCRGKSSEMLRYRESFALETQHFPDSPNHPNFPETLLRRGDVYHHTCVYRFGAR